MCGYLSSDPFKTFQDVFLTCISGLSYQIQDVVGGISPGCQLRWGSGAIVIETVLSLDGLAGLRVVVADCEEYGR